MRVRIAALLVLMFFVSGVAFGNEGKIVELEKENALLKERVGSLEDKVDRLLAIVEGGAVSGGTEAGGEQVVTSAGVLSQEDVDRIASQIEAKHKGKKPILSSLDLEVYGFLKLDSSWDSSNLSVGNFARWANNEAFNDNDQQFNMTANQTRLGLNIKGPAGSNGLQTSGKVEVDFYGTGAAENKAGVMLRHAYLLLDWPEDRFSILAGQTSDVISPLVPTTLNYSVMWWCGNIGYRRPQIRLTKSFALNSDVDMTLTGAVVRSIGSTTSAFTTDSGKDSGSPGVQGRVGVKFPFFGHKPTEIGFSGHWSKEEVDTTIAGDSRHFDSWSVNVDVQQPINEWLTIKGEAFQGTNLSSVLGGIGQGVNVVALEEIGTQGGWVAASLGPWDKWAFNLGAGMECVDSADVVIGSRTKNQSIFGNVIYSLNKSTKVGLELSHWRTEYKGNGDGEGSRVQASFIYSF